MFSLSKTTFTPRFRQFYDALDVQTMTRVASVVNSAILDLSERAPSFTITRRIAIPNAMLFIERTDTESTNIPTIEIDCAPENTYADVFQQFKKAADELSNALATLDGTHTDMYEFITRILSRDELQEYSERMNAITREMDVAYSDAEKIRESRNAEFRTFEE
ncbi:hypothetical protein UFOVP453_35 [uncultured Caudovirales phage]|uniref:Uncharacterized protein n=1 Tax=uncultured Caudovirales phage TaxID=2100421 RepID=A0A6J5MGD3_9CAUD|nr:hypothetical protein UFOVP453_35 [uncultured Caudovirales phage]